MTRGDKMAHRPIETIEDLADAAVRRLHARIGPTGDDSPNDEEFEIFRAAFAMGLCGAPRPESPANPLGIPPDEQNRIQREIADVFARAVARHTARVAATEYAGVR